MAKYLNSTGVSLLWNKIKELILDKIASIVPFVYVSLDDNELSDSQKLHNLHMFNDDNEYHHPKYIIFCRNGSTIFEGLGTKLYISDDEFSYISIDIENAKCNVEFDTNTGNLKFINSESYNSIGEIMGVTDSNFQNVEKSGIKNEKRGLILNSYYGINYPWLFQESDVFDTVYLSKYRDTLLTTDEKLSNYKLVKFLREQKYYGVLDKTLVVCLFKNNINDPYENGSLGYIQGNKVYVPNFEKSLFEVYEITETATTRIDDILFISNTNMWSVPGNDDIVENINAPFVECSNDKQSANMIPNGEGSTLSVIFSTEHGKEAIYTKDNQFRTLPTNGEAGQTIICKGHGGELGFDNNNYIDVEWQDNFEQTLGNGLVINVPLFALDKIKHIILDGNSNYLDASSNNNFTITVDGSFNINLDEEDTLVFKTTEYATKYKNRFNIICDDSLSFLESYCRWCVFDITLNSNVSKELTIGGIGNSVSFNPGETKEIVYCSPMFSPSFNTDGNWTIKIKNIIYTDNSYIDINRLEKIVANNWPLNKENFDVFIYPILKDVVTNKVSKEFLEENYATKDLINSFDSDIITINNRLADQIPVKISYDNKEGTITFETESQKIAFPMADPYVSYDQYVTGFATGDLNIQQGTYTVPVDKNGRFKRVFPYDTTTSMPLFNLCKEVTHIDMSRFDTKKITSMRHTFKDCSNLTYLNISGWDTSKITGLTDFVFCRCSKLKHIDVSNWNTSGFTDMNSMFSGCSVLEDINVSNWNVSNVTNLRYTFQGCYALKELNVSNWNVSKVTNFFYTFSYLNLKTLDLSKWQNTVATNLAGMFEECKVTSLNLSGFNTANVTTMAGMFDGCNALQTLNLGSNWNMNSNTDVSSMFNNCTKLTTVSGTITNLKKPLNLSSCPLTNASAMVFINGISENGSGVTLTFKKSTYDTLTAAQKAIATGKGATINYI